MATLTQDTWATQIHPETGQEIAEVKLPRGASYQFISRQQDGNGSWWLKIDVDGYWYEVQCPYSHLFSDGCTHTTANYEGAK